MPAGAVLTNRIASILVAGILLGGCAFETSPSPSPTPAPRRTEAPAGTSTRQVDRNEAERLKRVMIPLIKAMNNPRPLDQVKVGIIDDSA